MKDTETPATGSTSVGAARHKSVGDYWMTYHGLLTHFGSVTLMWRKPGVEKWWSLSFFFNSLLCFLSTSVIRQTKDEDLTRNGQVRNGVHVRRVDSLTLVFNLSSHRYPYVVFVCISRFNDS